MEARLTRKQAIRAKCLDCCCGQYAEVRKCPAEDCPLWPFRMGTEIKIETEAEDAAPVNENPTPADEFQQEQDEDGNIEAPADQSETAAESNEKS